MEEAGNDRNIMVPLLWPSKYFCLFVSSRIFSRISFFLLPCIFPIYAQNISRVRLEVALHLRDSIEEGKFMCRFPWRGLWCLYFKFKRTNFEIYPYIRSEVGHIGGYGWCYSYKGDLNSVPSKWSSFAEVYWSALVYQVRSFRRWSMEMHRAFLKGFWISSCMEGHSMYSGYLGQSVSL